MIRSGKEYQRHTGYGRHGLGGHRLDWSNQPDVYKEYPIQERFSLPREISKTDVRLSQVLHGEVAEEYPSTLSVGQLGAILALGYGITAKSRHAGGDFFYRSVPSAGALYPCELYLATRSVSGLESGLYHYSVGRHALVRLREGYFSAFDPPALKGMERGTPLLTFFISAIFFRSAWKYRERSYRYHLLDSGHLIENLALTFKAYHLPYEVDYDFDDQKVNVLLGLDPEHEVCLAVVRIMGKDVPSGNCEQEIGELPLSFRESGRVSPREEKYAVLSEVHTATSQIVVSPGPLTDMLMEAGPVPSSWMEIREPEIWPESVGYADAVLRRRSMRNFVKKDLAEPQFKALLGTLRTTDGLPNSRNVLQEKSVCVGFLAGSVEGVEPGCYWFDRYSQSIGLIGAGSLTDRMMRACLDQEWLAQAALHVFFVTNLDLLEQNWGLRGYRYAMLTAGRLGQRIYLGATALGLGCCGIGAFYDKEASELIGLNASSAMLYLVAAGPVKKVF